MADVLRPILFLLFSELLSNYLTLQYKPILFLPSFLLSGFLYFYWVSSNQISRKPTPFHFHTKIIWLSISIASFLLYCFLYCSVFLNRLRFDFRFILLHLHECRGCKKINLKSNLSLLKKAKQHRKKLAM